MAKKCPENTLFHAVLDLMETNGVYSNEIRRVGTTHWSGTWDQFARAALQISCGHHSCIGEDQCLVRLSIPYEAQDLVIEGGSWWIRTEHHPTGKFKHTETCFVFIWDRHPKLGPAKSGRLTVAGDLLWDYD